MIEIRPLPGLFGADVFGVDLTQPLGEESILQLADALVEHRVLRIRDQRMTNADYSRFGKLLGQPILFPGLADRDARFHELIHISNSPSIPDFMRDGAAFWHTDGTYDVVPVSTTMLYAVEAPDEGGETLFADLAAAYEALPPETKKKLEGLEVFHRMSGGKRFDYEKQVSDDGVAYGNSMDSKRGVQVTRHQLVLRHPISGRKALYGIAGTSFGIEGMSPEAGEELLTSLKHHATQEQFRSEIKAGTGDLLIWDCLSTIHSAVPIEYTDDPGQRRILIRLSVTGLPKPYRHLPAPFSEEAGVARQAVSSAEGTIKLA